MAPNTLNFRKLDALETELRKEHQQQLAAVENMIEIEELKKEQEMELLSARSLREKIEGDLNQDTRELRFEIYTHCCKNSFGFLHPMLGFTDTCLEWYKIIRHMVPRMKYLDEFLKIQRTKTNIGKILPSKFYFTVN